MLIVQGKVIDAETNQPLELANVVITDSTGKPFPVNGNTIFRQSDTKGAFNLPVAIEDTFVKVSYVGLQSVIIPAKEAAKIKEFKLATAGNLSEVVVTAKKKEEPCLLLWIGGVVVLSLLAYGAYSYLIKSK